MTPDERALLDAVIAAPDDDLPRLVYADWLEENGRSSQARVLRSEHPRTGGSPNGYYHFAKQYPDLWERLVYLPGANPPVILSVSRGVIFLMAWWSGPSRQAFAGLAGALRVNDPNGSLTVVVIDVDGTTEDFNASVGLVHLSGAGEALWVCGGRLVGVTRFSTSNEELRWLIREVQSSRCGDRSQ